MKKEVCVLCVCVNSIEESLKFYCDALDFEVETTYGDCIVRLKSKGVTLLLKQIEDGYPPHPCVVPGFETEDISAEIENLKTQGVKILHDKPQVFPAGLFVAYKDISGNIFELLEFISEKK
ncbi:MAG: hypothetical protein HN356_07650 [Calditrichaeota bacterium]|jgi:predicted enzyme related to lactoylglutathione lyase|nr:hypothetical protein [Calditrichota bacterium]MBT7787914.1 hypothetical protein [Calditrichota bacterium]